MINIDNLMELGGSVRVEVTPEDLRMFAESVVERTIVARDRQAKQEASKEEAYISEFSYKKYLNFQRLGFGLCRTASFRSLCLGL